jgi:predicted RNA-binding Zn-ribbon protein involved in translation (DUF1610 family)
MVSKEALGVVREGVENFQNQRCPEYGLLQFSAARVQVRHQQAKADASDFARTSEMGGKAECSGLGIINPRGRDQQRFASPNCCEELIARLPPRVSREAISKIQKAANEE